MNYFFHVCVYSASLYTSCILIGVFINGAVPLFYEITCETSYPVAEGVTCGVLTLVNNLVGVMFLFIMLIPNIGLWTNLITYWFYYETL